MYHQITDTIENAGLEIPFLHWYATFELYAHLNTGTTPTRQEMLNRTRAAMESAKTYPAIFRSTQPSSVVVQASIGGVTGTAELTVGSANGGLLYQGDFEKATANGKISLTGPTTILDYNEATRGIDLVREQVEIVSNPVRQGQRATRIFMTDGLSSGADDVRNAKRREIVMRYDGSAKPVGAYNTDRWYAFSILIPTDAQFRTDDAFSPLTNWLTVFQIGTHPIGTQNWWSVFNLIPHRNANVWEVGLNSNSRYHYFGNYDRGVWHDFLVKFRPHRTNGSAHTIVKWRKKGGTFSTVINDTQENISALINQDTNLSMSAATCIYTSTAQLGTHVIYVDGPWVGETEADVLPFFDDSTPVQTQLNTPSSVSITW
jgi:hypothetical protein